MDNYFGMNTCLLVGSKLVLLGSLGRLASYGSSICICDMPTKQWKWLRAQGQASLCLNGHASFLVDDEIYVQGGQDPVSGFRGAIHRLDLTLLEWRNVEVSGKQPMARRYHVGQFLERNRQYLCFGGFALGRQRIDKDLWVFNVDAKVWRVAKVTGVAPMPRFGMSSCLEQERVFLFGGNDAAGFVSNKLHVLDCRRGKFNWEMVVTQTGIFRAFATLTYLDGLFVVYGGYNQAELDQDGVCIFEPPDYQLEHANPASITYRLTMEAEAIYGHSAVVYCGEMYVLDGVGCRDLSMKRLRKC